jgi:ribosomal protein S27E
MKPLKAYPIQNLEYQVMKSRSNSFKIKCIDDSNTEVKFSRPSVFDSSTEGVTQIKM